MDYEKIYKDALSRAQKLKKTCDSTAVIGWCEYIFPELKESEDEKIKEALRKRIIRYDPNNEILIKEEGISQKQFLAWLEKQGEQKSVWHDKDEEPCEDRQVLICLSGNYYVDFYHKEDKRFYMFCKPKHYLHEIEKWAYLDDLLEKQCENKSSWSKEDEVKLNSILSCIKHCQNEDTEARYNGNQGIDLKRYESMLDWLKSLKERVQLKQSEQKPDDKVEPKFKEGDWVVNNYGDSWHIDSFDKKNYQVSDGKGNYNYFSILHQDEMRFWTIENVKDGDVLVYEDYDAVKIFIYQYGKVHCYCSLTNSAFVPHNYYFGVREEQLYRLHLADKKQCDLLFAKMKEEGYEWDAEKKELIKFK